MDRSSNHCINNAIVIIINNSLSVTKRLLKHFNSVERRMNVIYLFSR